MLSSQIILTVIILFIVYKVFAAYKKDSFSKPFFLLWIGFWSIALFTVLNTEVLQVFANILKIGRGVDLAIYLSIILIFYLIFKLFIHLKVVDQKLTKLAREISLGRIKNKN